METTVPLAPELMNLNGRPALIKNRALEYYAAYLRDALAAWLEKSS
ncbi:phage polarity suppression protein [Franconibacter daqui]